MKQGWIAVMLVVLMAANCAPVATSRGDSYNEGWEDMGGKLYAKNDSVNGVRCYHALGGYGDTLSCVKIR